MKIYITYYASLREQAGKSAESIEVDQAELTPSILYCKLKQKYSFTLTENHIRAAVNDQFIDLTSYLLQENDRVAFIPPVAGG
jgi:sulfur-carrier protein